MHDSVDLKGLNLYLKIPCPKYLSVKTAECSRKMTLIDTAKLEICDLL
jgi:hypothetical protein